MKHSKIFSFIMLAALIAFTSCVKDLDTSPIDEDNTTSEDLFSTPEGYTQGLAKLYAGLSLTGQEGPAGDGDIVGVDEGFSSYLRNYWKAQELTTDEAVNGWGDEGLGDFHIHSWTSSNPFVRGMYYRIYFQLPLANEFIRESADSKLDDRGISGETKATIQIYRAEARFLRALSYFHALDLFGNVPFVTEDDPIGAYLPEQIQRADLFEYIESELLDIEEKLIAPMQNDYPRADRAAAWALLAKLYLNAEVYAGEDRYTDCITYCNKIIEAGYSLHPEYDELFMADNHQCQGTIFSIAFDGTTSQTWGGTTFLVCAAIGGSMSPSEFGVEGGWGGNRTTSALVEKFGDISSGSLVTDRKSVV